MRKIYLVLLTVLFAATSQAQTVIINTGTAGTPAYNAGPVYRSAAASAFDASRYTYLYTASELAAAGITSGSVITLVGWVKNNTATSLGVGGIFRIFMKNTSAASFSLPTETWANLNTGAVMVYENLTQTIPATANPTYIDFPLTTSFTYTGGSLEISTEWDINQVSGNASTGTFDWLWSTVVDRIYGTGNTTLAPITTLSSTTNSISTIDDRRPFIKITYSGGTTGIDVGAQSLVAPAVSANNCYTSAEPVTIRIRNYSTNPINFSVNPMTVTTNVTGAVTQTLTGVVNTGTLAPAATLDVPMSATLNMSATGVYTFNAFTTVTGDVTPANDAMTAVNITKAVLAVGTASVSPGSLCITGTPTLSTAGATGYGGLQWQQSTTPVVGFTNIPGATTSPYTLSSPITQTMYFRLVASCNGNTVTSNEVTVTVNSPQVTGTTPGAACGPGPVAVTLGATGSAGTTLNWYNVPSGGVPIGTGSPFTTPPISVNTPYYVSASNGGGSANLGLPAQIAGTSGAGTTNFGLVFDALTPFTLTSVVVYPVAAAANTAGTVTIDVVSSTGAVLNTATVNVIGNPAASATAQTVTLNFAIAAGTNLKLRPGSRSATITGLLFEPSASAPPGGNYGYPFVLPGVVSINHSTLTAPPANTARLDLYYYFYNWSIVTGCESARTSVLATVTTPPSATISYAGSPYCTTAGTATVTRIGTAGGTYSSTAGLTINPATGDVTLATSTPATYTVTYTIPASGGCPVFTTTGSITIIAGSSATISYVGSPYCTTGGTATVTRIGTGGGTYSSTAGLTINPATGDVTLGTSTPGTYTVTYTIPPSGGCSVFTTTASITVNNCSVGCVENFDALVVPALPASWTATVGGTCVNTARWETVNTSSSSAPNAAFANDANCISDEYLDSRVFAVAATASQLIFRNSYDLEASTSNLALGFDGMVLEISINGGAFTDIITTGGSFVTGGYNRTISGGFSSPIANRNAWSGNSGGFITTAVNLPAAAQGQNVVFRWRRATDSSVGAGGVWIDDVYVIASATISYAGSPYCGNAGIATVTRTGTAGGTYSSTAGLTLNAATGDVTLGTSTPATYTVTYTVAASGGCPVFTTTGPITINAGSSATITYAGSPYCINGGTATVTRTGTPGGTYSSTPGLTLNAVTGDVTLGTSTLGTYTVTYTIAAAGGCATYTTTTTITINPIPGVNPVPNQTVCNNAPTAPVVFSGPVPGTVYNWINNTPSIGLAASGSGNIASFNAINTTNAPVTATITVTPGTSSTVTQTFNYTGAVQTFIVPAGVTSINIQAFGAQGNTNAVGGVSVGGLGGSANGTLAVTPGQTLFINVGGGGVTSITGGFNGGGNAGINAACSNAQGGGGGGASDVRITANTLANRVIVGAGGGGAAGNRVVNCGRGTGGGGGGGLYGGGGGAGWPGIAGSEGPVPTGGTQVAGGAGGVTTFSPPGPTNGFPGALSIGGDGGTEGPSAQAASTAAEPGGIGGGLTGGSGLYNVVNPFCGQSGAGGSSYIGGVTSGATSSGIRSGNGLVTISYGTSGTSCTGPSVSFNITVNPTPNAVATPATQTVCTGTPITPIVLTSAVSGSTYSWTRNNTVNVTGIAASGPGNISGTLVNNTAVQQTVLFTIIPTANGCPGAAITATVIVNPAPTVTCPANVTVNNDPGICGAVVTYAPTTTGTPAPTLTYAFTGATTGSGSGSGSGSTFNVGVTTVTVTATNVCGAVTCSFTVTVIDNQAPTITCPAPIVRNTDPASCTASIVTPNPVTADNCAVTLLTWVLTGATTGTSPATGINNVGTRTFNIGVTTVAYTVKDAAGNTTNCSYTVTVNDGQLPTITAQPVNRTVCAGSNVTFNVTAVTSPTAGGPLAYQWQQWNGSSWVNVTTGTGATTSALTLTNVTLPQNTNTFRVVLTGLCTIVNSNAASLYVNPLPTISLTTSIPPVLLPGQTLSITATVSPAGGSFVWFKNGVVVPGVTGAVLSGLTVDNIGTYRAVYTDLNGCVSTSADVTITGQASGNLYVYPNPNRGVFQVRFYNTVNEAASVIIYDEKGARVYVQKFTTQTPYSRLDIDISRLPAGTYLVEVVNGAGNRIGAKRIIKQN